VLGRLGNAAHPSGESGQGGPHQKNELYGEVWSVGGERRWGAVAGGGGRQLAVRGGRTRRHCAQSVVDSAKERLERAVSGGARQAGNSGCEGPEGLSGLEVERL
jgi:hypothetical protein